MHISSRRHMLDMLFPLGLLLAFAASAVMVILMAANLYTRTAQDSSRAYTARTVLAYVTEKVHQNDVEGGVSAGSFAGCPALILERNNEGTTYCTYLYAYDGSLRELMVQQGTEARPGDGIEILPLKAFLPRQETENLIYVTCTDENGKTAESFLNISSIKE